MDGWITIGTKLDTKNFDKELKDLETQLEKFNKDIEDYESIDFKKDNYDYSYRLQMIEKIKSRIAEIKEEQSLTNNESAKYNVNIEEINSNISKISTSMGAVIKKVGKWALAIFSIRSAYMFIRQSVSTLSQYDEQLANDIEFIRYSLAMTIAPIVKFIVDLVYKLMSLINAIWTRLFGVALFSKDLAKNFKSAKNSASGLKKELAGFDEMNILGSNGSTGLAFTPSFNPSLANKNIDTWLDKTIEKFEKFGTKIVETINGIFPKINFGAISTSFVNEVKGAWQIIKGIFTNNKEKINQGIGTLVNNLGNKIKTLPSMFEIGLMSTQGVSGVVARFGKYLGEKFAPDILKVFKQLGDGIKAAFKDTLNAFVNLINNLINRINNVLKPMRNAVAGVAGGVGVKVTGGVSNIPKMPKLAKGGIVNMPGRGVNYAGANIAEQRPEGIIPLTDSQQMALLGEAIGKFITINATVVNSMNGRVLSREIQKIQNQGDFAMNR